MHILFVEIHVDYEFSVLKSRITNFLTQMMVDLFFGKQSSMPSSRLTFDEQEVRSSCDYLL